VSFAAAERDWSAWNWEVVREYVSQRDVMADKLSAEIIVVDMLVEERDGS
jgi:hypothetical protein